MMQLPNERGPAGRSTGPGAGDVTSGPEVVSPEADEFLRGHTRRYLLTLRKDGWPSGVPMGGYYNERALYFNTYGRSQKVRNLERDPRACCVIVPDEVIDAPPGDAPSKNIRIRGLAVSGNAEVMPPGSAIPENEARPAVRTGDIQGPGQLAARRLEEGKRVVIRLVPNEITWVGERSPG